MSHLLIVDDDHNTLASLSRAFRLAGYEATVAESAARALELLQVQTFDLIFSDVVMPLKDGLTLLAEIRSLGLNTPVVMMSGQGTLEMAVRATKLGAYDFLEKPLSLERTLLVLKNAVEASALPALILPGTGTGACVGRPVAGSTGPVTITSCSAPIISSCWLCANKSSL